jgi:hypothetical protein
MTDKPYTGEYRWRGEAFLSPVDVWNGKEWIEVSAPTTQKALEALEHSLELGLNYERYNIIRLALEQIHA